MNKLLAIVVTLLVCIFVVASTASQTANSDDDDARRTALNRQEQHHYSQHRSSSSSMQQPHHHQHHHRRIAVQRKPIDMSWKKSTEDTQSTQRSDYSTLVSGGGSSQGLGSKNHHNRTSRPLRLRRLHMDSAHAQLAPTGYAHRTGGNNNFNRRTVRNFAARNAGGTVNNEWSNGNGNTYNVRPIGAGGHSYAVTATSMGKDDILRDVEHINANGAGVVNNEWMHRSDTEFVTQPTTTTPTPTSTTENPFATSLNGRKGGGSSNDPKNLESRHICMQQRTIQMPVKTTEVYTRPIWKHISTPCQPPMQMNQMCTRVEMVHEPAYRDVIRHKATKQITYDCCPGWTRLSKMSSACMKPVCSTSCRNGGTCVAPDTCSCQPGYSGRFCETDINECKVEKPCDQLCFNTEGSYYCKCREGFILQSDKQSCKKIDNHEDDAFEARDLENEVDSNDEVTSRLHKIERTLANERIQTNDLQKSLQATYHLVDSLKGRLSTLEKQQQDITHLQSNVMSTESRTRKLESIISMLYKCRSSPGPYCP